MTSRLTTAHSSQINDKEAASVGRPFPRKKNPPGDRESVRTFLWDGLSQLGPLAYPLWLGLEPGRKFALPLGLLLGKTNIRKCQ
jgi:hypothetical protein